MSSHDETQRFERPPLTMKEKFDTELDELKAINEMIRKYVEHPTPEGKARIRKYLTRWMKTDEVD
jgi:hypothetical protein